MKKPVVIIGMGEMGELFAKGFLKIGHPVYPIIRGMDWVSVVAEIPEPELVLVAVGETALPPLLESLPEAWRGSLGLLQNELLPGDWQGHGIIDPTVIVVWFDKKKGRPFVAVQSTPVCGPKAGLIIQSLAAIEVPCHEIPPQELLYELVRKKLYILTINIAGLKLPPGGTVSELWQHHRVLAESVAGEILTIQEWLSQTPLPRQRLMAALPEDFECDPEHICKGRTAPERLQRSLDIAKAAGISVPTLEDIAAIQNGLNG